MEEKEYLKLSDLLDLITKFREEPSEEKMGEIKKFVEQFQVKEYMPLEQKRVCAEVVVYQLNKTKGSSVDIQTELIARSAIFGLLLYVVNLVNDVAEKIKLTEVYDALSEFGIIDYILDFCYNDYCRFEKIVSGAINFSNILGMMEIIKEIEPANIEELIKTVNDFKTELTTEKIKDLKSILNGTSPEWEEFRKEMEGEALSVALGKKKKEE